MPPNLLEHVGVVVRVDVEAEGAKYERHTTLQIVHKKLKLKIVKD